MSSVKTTTYDQNNNILWYFQIFKAQKSSKSGWTVQGIVQSGLLLLCTESTLFSIELPENCIYLSQSELSNFFMYLIRSATVWMITKSYDHIAGVWFVNHVSLQTEFDNRNFCHQLIVAITISKAKRNTFIFNII